MCRTRIVNIYVIARCVAGAGAGPGSPVLRASERVKVFVFAKST